MKVEEVFRDRHHDLMSYALAQDMPTQDAEDIVADTYLRILEAERAGNYSDEGKGDGWVNTIEMNLILDRRRAFKRRPEFVSLEILKETELSRPVERNVLRRGLWDEVHSLRPERSSVIQLRIGEGYKIHETSQMLGIPENTVKSRMRRGIRELEEVV